MDVAHGGWLPARRRAPALAVLLLERRGDLDLVYDVASAVGIPVELGEVK